jgi:hypothetical protein
MLLGLSVVKTDFKGLFFLIKRGLISGVLGY